MKTIIFAGVLTALLNTGPATAGVISIDFEDQLPGCCVFDNLVTKGFQFSPSHHYQITGSTAGEPDVFNYPSSWIGWDGSLFGENGENLKNPNYTGIPAGGEAVIWVNYFGKSFSLQSVNPVALFGGSWMVQSSNGGSAEIFCCDQPPPTVGFSGLLWTNITWLLFTDTNRAGVNVGFDNLTLTVPEPATALLVGGGLMFLAITRRRRRSQ